MSRGKSQRTIEIVDTAAEILEVIQPASVRAVCYRLFARQLIREMSRNETNRISRILTAAREEGRIPWGWIVDESREAEKAPRWTDPLAIIDAAVSQYRRDNWQDQDYRVEVWSEKGTVRGTLAPVLAEYGLTFRVMHGYASATVVNDIAELSTALEKPLIALYVGDWDPSGKHMSDVDLPRRLTQYGGSLTIERIALVKSDLRGLPSFDARSKSKDPRYRWFRETVRTRCYELDAMPPPDLRKRVEEKVLEHIDIDRWEHARTIEAAEITSMERYFEAFQEQMGSSP